MATPTGNSVPISHVSLTGDYSINALIMGAKWGGGAGTPVTLTYSFPDPYSSYWSTNPTTGYGPTYGSGEPWDYFTFALDSTERAAAVSALTTWSNVANVRFTQVADNASTVGEIRFQWTGSDLNEQAHAYFPSSAPLAGDVWLSLSASWDGFSPGTYGHSTLIHELGHALGLKHPFAPAGSSNTVLPSNEDGYPFSIMSYDAYPGYTGSDVNFYPTTPMLDDIAAIQYLYGANMSYRTGNNTYIFTQGQYYFQTIWDAGGTDTIVWNGTTESAEIDLRGGAWSDLGNSLDFTDSNGSYLGSVGYDVAIYYTVKIENATGGGANDTLIGNGLNNVLLGGAGNDTLDGRAGNDILDGGIGTDSMTGGLGNDTYVLDDAGDSFTELTGQGTDLVKSSMDYTLGIYVERLTLTGTAINGTGNDSANILTGNASDNMLTGGAGVDTLIGGAGNDTYYVDLKTTGIGALAVASLQDIITELTGAASGNDTVVLEGAVILTKASTITLAATLENMDASDTGSTLLNLTGNASANILTGNDANNVLNGGVGADTLFGAAGNDTYAVDNLADKVYETATANVFDTTDLGGTDTVQSSVAYMLGAYLENLKLKGTTAINGIGNDLNNVLTGNAAANVLEGGVGADSMTGGLGNDTYVVDNTGDVVMELTAQGTDLVNSSIDYTLGSYVEKLTLTGTAISGAGNVLNNTITGNASNNILDGSAGADTLSGLDGNDTLNGGIDKDILWGGDGADHLVFNTALNATTNVDKIMDFSHDEGDLIMLSKSVFAALGDEVTEGEIRSGAGFTTATTTDQHLIYNSTTGNLYYDADGMGGVAAKLFATIDLNGMTTTHPDTLVASDFGVFA